MWRAINLENRASCCVSYCKTLTTDRPGPNNPEALPYRLKSCVTQPGVRCSTAAVLSSCSGYMVIALLLLIPLSILYNDDDYYHSHCSQTKLRHARPASRRSESSALSFSLLAHPDGPKSAQWRWSLNPKP